MGRQLVFYLGPSDMEELEARLRSDIDLWAAVVKKAGLQPN